MSDKNQTKEKENIEETLQEISENLEKEAEAIAEKVIVETATEEMTAEPEKMETAEPEKVETAEAEEKETEMQKKRIGLKVLLGVILALVVVYFGMSFFFMNHFYYNTSINGKDFSGRSIETVAAYLEEQADRYVLTIQGREGKTEKIQGTDIELSHENTMDLEADLKKQNAFLWFTAFLPNGGTEIDLFVSYNGEKLDQAIENLDCLKKENQIAPVSAKPVYNGIQFEIQSESVGTQVDREKLAEAVTESVCNLDMSLDMDAAGCYVAPTYTAESQEVKDAWEQANTYLASQITYEIDEGTEVVDKSMIAEWISFDDQMNVKLSKKKIQAYIQTLCDAYDTVGKVHKITTPTGKKAEVSGGTYGTKIDESGEYKQLVKDIKAGAAVTREPEYSQKAASTGDNIWGNTYLEVDLTEQHMWYIKKGKVALESDVVTGAPVPERRTPQGVYSVLEMKRNKILRGEIQANGRPEYETPVAYWIRVTWTGIGFHDATWQRKFGGQRYKQGYGSHGCINMPYNKVAELYGMVKKGCPIVIHY